MKHFLSIILLLVLSFDVRCQEYNWGVTFINLLNMNHEKSTGFRLSPAFDFALGSFLTFKPKKSRFGSEMNFNLINQGVYYDYKTKSGSNITILINSKCYDYQIFLYNNYHKKWTFKYGFGCKFHRKLKEFKEIEDRDNNRITEINNVETKNLEYDIQKILIKINSSIQVGCSFIFKQIYVGFMFSYDVLPLFKQKIKMNENFSIDPHFMSITLYTRLNIKRLIKIIKTENKKSIKV